MKDNPLLTLADHGQSVWIDYIRRGAIESGQLARWISDDGVRGVTSNPAIFEKAIAGSHDYDAAIESLASEGKDVDEILDVLTVEDVQRTADLLRPVFDRTGGLDGFVSLEVSPELARDTAATIAEAHRLRHRVDRPNALIKVPATGEGVPAIRQLIGDGVSINVTLLFGLDRYRAVVDAWLTGLERRAARGDEIRHVTSVASFFLSRIDVLVDGELEAKERLGGEQASETGRLEGETAIALAKVAYSIYEEMVAGERFARLAARGARPQRLLWASTSTKNPAYRDVKYVDALVGPATVTTLPIETLDAYRDHGRPEPTLQRDVDRARQVLRRLGDLGISLEAVAGRLEDEAVRKFADPWRSLHAALETKRAAA
jgi:transaldolase